MRKYTTAVIPAAMVSDSSVMVADGSVIGKEAKLISESMPRTTRCLEFSYNATGADHRKFELTVDIDGSVVYKQLGSAGISEAWNLVKIPIAPLTKVSCNRNTNVN